MPVIASAWQPASITTMRRDPTTGGKAAEIVGAGADIVSTISDTAAPSMPPAGWQPRADIRIGGSPQLTGHRPNGGNRRRLAPERLPAAPPLPMIPGSCASRHFGTGIFSVSRG